MSRRMFSKEVTETDAFLDMPAGSQLLYFHLGMEADDDGFISSPRKVMRNLGASEDELKVLFAKKFLLPFDNGLCVVKHWRINNYIRKQIYKGTKYTRERAQLYIRENGAYTLNPEGAKLLPEGHFTTKENDATDHVDIASTQRRPSIVQDSIVKDSKESADAPPAKVFKRPTLDEVKAYCVERANRVDPQKWYDHYTSNGWKVGRTAMKDWKAAVRTWERNTYGNGRTAAKPANVVNTQHTSKLAQAMAEKAKKHD